jgi:hypothetical protein
VGSVGGTAGSYGGGAGGGATSVGAQGIVVLTFSGAVASAHNLLLMGVGN